MTLKSKKHTPLVSPSKHIEITEQDIIEKIRAMAIKKAVVEMHLWKMDELEEKLRINPTIH
jgi:hypothetical protein